VKHLDEKVSEGVDIVGDLSNPSFRTSLVSMGFKSVLCSNVLEHVPDREQLAASLTQIVPSGGYLFVSCPYRFPYHPDPIDTMFRPGIDDLALLFPETQVHEGTVVSGGTYGWMLLSSLLARPVSFLKRVPRRSPKVETASQSPQDNPNPTHTSFSSRVFRLFPWLFRQFKATCVVLVKTQKE
jgi:hypothetical protein